MKRKRNLWIGLGSLFLVAVVLSAFVLMQPSAEDILVQAFETVKTVKDGHAVLAIDVDTLEKDTRGTVEVWAVRVEDGPGSFRVEVLETNQEKAQGAIIVNDGETLWVYSASENKVFKGTPDEAQAMMEENDFMGGEHNPFFEGKDGKTESSDQEHPENAEEAVQRLLEYFSAGKAGNEMIAGETANVLKLEPIPEQMPSEYAGVGGFLNLWIGQESSLPLAVNYTGGSLGEFSATIVEFEVNAGVDDALFSFDVPVGAEVVTFADLEPQAITLEQAGLLAEFDFLTPAETPPGATLVDILDVQGTLIQRYTLPEGESFTITQGIAGESSDAARTPNEGQSVDVRGTTGQLYMDEDGGRVLLTWTEGNIFYTVAGELTPEQAYTIAESLE